jgi:hypothetical protein
MELEPESPTSTDNTAATVEYEILRLPDDEPADPSKSGPKPKRLVAVEVYGYEVGRGNTKRVVSPDEVYKLAALGCNNKEISTWFDINKDVLLYNFGDIIEKGREDMKMRLRQAMWKNAWAGNVVMQIWLSKQYLGFTDSPTNTEATAPLPWSED